MDAPVAAAASPLQYHGPRPIVLLLGAPVAITSKHTAPCMHATYTRTRGHQSTITGEAKFTAIHVSDVIIVNYNYTITR